MVIYQKQPRVAHRQYCTVLQQNRLTRVPPPSQKAFFPSSWVSCVNIHCGIKTAFSSAESDIHFRSFCFQREKSKKEEYMRQRGEIWFTPEEWKSCRWILSSWGFPHPAMAAFDPRAGHADMSWHSESRGVHPSPPPHPPQLLESVVGIWTFMFPDCQLVWRRI